MASYFGKKDSLFQFLEIWNEKCVIFKKNVGCVSLCPKKLSPGVPCQELNLEPSNN